MNPKGLFDDAETLKVVAERLSRCRGVSKLDKEEHNEAWSLTHAFHDLEESFRKILDVQFPRLTHENLNEMQVNSLLLEIGEEFRHILYHIKDLEFYSYLQEIE